MESNVTFYIIYLTGRLRGHRPLKETAKFMCLGTRLHISKYGSASCIYLIELENKHQGIAKPKLFFSKRLWGKIMTMCQTEGAYLNFFYLLGIVVSPSFWMVSKDQAQREGFRYPGTGSLCCTGEI